MTNIKGEIKRYFFMVLGCISYAVSLVVFLVPNQIVAGGVTGAATLFNLLTGGYFTYFVVGLNVPILLLGLKQKGWKFILNCFITITVLGLLTDLLIFLPPVTDNPILAAMYGGIAQGIGIGLFVKYEMSSGGTELLGRITYSKIPYGNIPTHIAVLDAIVVISGAVVLNNVENILYALILIFISAKVSDIFLTGLNSSKLCHIITEKPEEVAAELMKNSPRGITRLNGTGMYTRTDRGVLITCIKKQQLEQLKQIVKSIDDKSFIIVSETKEVYGKGFTSV